ncbi:MAG: hypothetical protein IJS05_04585 [Paludibacteraceae bacterium]|nr:hypothetical protein [Paludibacteraceae bacterium]
MIHKILQSEIDALEQQLDLAQRRVEQLRALLAECRQELENTDFASSEPTTLVSCNEPTTTDSHNEEIVLDPIENEVDNEVENEVDNEAESEVDAVEATETPSEPVIVEAQQPTVQLPTKEQQPWYGGTDNGESNTKTGVTLPPVSNIREAMSVGDRFLFQRELFATDGELMNKTIEALNNLTSFEQAMAYIDKRFRWDKESQAYEIFVNILKRRFPNN